MDITDKYLASIGIARDSIGKPSIDDLNRIHHAHITTYAYNSIRVLRGSDVHELPADAFDDLVACKIGGICAEHCSLLMAVLRDLGYDVSVGAGEVWVGYWSPPLPHRSIVVTLNGERYISDAGHTLRFPGVFKLEHGVDQLLPDGTIIVMTCKRDAADGHEVWTVNTRSQGDGEIKPIHRVHVREFTREELDGAVDWLFTEESPFPYGWLLQIVTEDLSNITLAAGSWAGKGAPADCAKYVVRPPNGAEAATEYIPLSDVHRLEALIRKVFHVDMPPFGTVEEEQTLRSSAQKPEATPLD
ncbi:hypothetical protein JKP88DRAFT_283328 [Tribonema minus]|uniref:Arylamine N-acetyltransferase n=1 Tax=Tribonema minus TaxID=303371 RepID=A0A835YL51_9STRA|nr:hypothetical protein JKP88DRAFT_283328 [Tribonema minus]